MAIANMVELAKSDLKIAESLNDTWDYQITDILTGMSDQGRTMHPIEGNPKNHQKPL